MPALDRMRILDTIQYEVETSSAQALAWMGADIVKVEAPRISDPGRWTAGAGDYFWNWNANKCSVAINPRKPEGRQILLDMLPRFDVFVENYGPGAIERLDPLTGPNPSPSLLYLTYCLFSDVKKGPLNFLSAQMELAVPLLAGEYALPLQVVIDRESSPILDVPFGNCQFYTADLRQELKRGRRRADRGN